MLVRVDHNGNTYEFSRDNNGDGYWVPVTGRRKYMTVPIMLATELRRIAVANGTDPNLLAKSKPKRAEKSMGVRTKSSRSSKKGRFAVSLKSLMKTAEKYKEDDE